MTSERPVHASFRTRGLPRDWEAANDGRWLHVREPELFADRIEQITCATCLSYMKADAKPTTS